MTDTTELQERIERALWGFTQVYDAKDGRGTEVGVHAPVYKVLDAVLPIIRAAQADAWDEGLLREQKRCADLSFFDGYDFDEPSNPYREKED